MRFLIALAINFGVLWVLSGLFFILPPVLGFFVFIIVVGFILEMVLPVSLDWAFKTGDFKPKKGNSYETD